MDVDTRGLDGIGVSVAKHLTTWADAGTACTEGDRAAMKWRTLPDFSDAESGIPERPGTVLQEEEGPWRQPKDHRI